MKTLRPAGPRFTPSTEFPMNVDNKVEATLDAWQQQVAMIRQRLLESGGGHAGLADVAHVQVKTGLECILPFFSR